MRIEGMKASAKIVKKGGKKRKLEIYKCLELKQSIEKWQERILFKKLTSPTHLDKSDISALPDEKCKEPSDISNSCNAMCNIQ